MGKLIKKIRKFFSFNGHQTVELEISQEALLAIGKTIVENQDVQTYTFDFLNATIFIKTK